MSELHLVREEIRRLERELQHYRERERALLLREQIRRQHEQSQEYDERVINDESMPSYQESQDLLSQASGYNTPFGYIAPHERNIYPTFRMKAKSKSKKSLRKSLRKNRKSPKKSLRKSLRRSRKNLRK